MLSTVALKKKRSLYGFGNQNKQIFIYKKKRPLGFYGDQQGKFFSSMLCSLPPSRQKNELIINFKTSRIFCRKPPPPLLSSWNFYSLMEFSIEFSDIRKYFVLTLALTLTVTLKSAVLKT